eukprot:3471806-Prymnesium_polylepis.1
MPDSLTIISPTRPNASPARRRPSWAASWTRSPDDHRLTRDQTRDETVAEQPDRPRPRFGGDRRALLVAALVAALAGTLLARPSSSRVASLLSRELVRAQALRGRAPSSMAPSMPPSMPPSIPVAMPVAIPVPMPAPMPVRRIFGMGLSDQTLVDGMRDEAAMRAAVSAAVTRPDSEAALANVLAEATGPQTPAEMSALGGSALAAVGSAALLLSAVA